VTTLRELIRGHQPAKVYLPAWLDRLAALGIVSLDPLVVRRQRLVNIFAFASAFNVVGQMLVTGSQDFGALLVPNAILALFGLAFLPVPLLHRWGNSLGAHVLIALSVVGIVYSTWVFGRDSHVLTYFGMTGILFFVFGIEHWKHYAGWFVIIVVSILVSIAFASREGLYVPDNVTLREISATHTLLNTLFVNSLMIFFTLSTLRRAEVELEGEHVRSLALINTVFPPSIVARLRSGQEDRIADRIDGLTVLFADLVGFTQASRDLPPEEIIDYLDHLVRKFDRLCLEHGVDKIKTIGDCYMAVGGLTGDPRQQAIAIGKLAIAMVQSQATLPTLGGKKLSLRVGMHTGSATAGIIGDTRFSYDVWGDAVNMASRMESHSQPDRIQVSEAYREAVGDAFNLIERGIIEIRSLGPTRTYMMAEAAAA